MNHTSAFNTVHIIAAVIGVIGAIIVAITIFLLCKRRKKVKSTDTISKVETPVMSQVTNRNSSHSRFGQFATDFDNPPIEPPKPAIVHVEDISPLMQQQQLQLKLLNQQNSITSTSSSSSSNPSPPPPPYQP